MEITQFNQLNLDKLYTYTDYLSWKFEERVELLKGKIFKMAAPNRAHQDISMNLTGLFTEYSNVQSVTFEELQFELKTIFDF